MLFTTSISKAAEDDIRSAFLWYEKQRTNLGIEFEDDLNEAVDSISSNPLKTQLRYDNVRVYFLEKFPYGIHFRVTNYQILIVAVFHTSQNSEQWNDR